MQDKFKNDPSLFYSDFKLNTTSTVTALGMHDGSKLTYSANPDFYMFRVLNFDNNTWVEESKGPVIDRT